MNKLPPATKWHVVDSYQSGESVPEIACRLAISEELVRSAVATKRRPVKPQKGQLSESGLVFRVTLITYDPDLQKALITKLRTTPLYLDWRRKVLRRDRWRCQDCGNKGRLQVDHVYPLSAIIHNYRINSLEEAAECELIWRMSNGRTLCPTCHQRTETHGTKAKRLWVTSDEVD